MLVCSCLVAAVHCSWVKGCSSMSWACCIRTSQQSLLPRPLYRHTRARSWTGELMPCSDPASESQLCGDVDRAASCCSFRKFTGRLSHSGGMLRSFPKLTSLQSLPKLTGDEYGQLMQWLPGVLQCDNATHSKEIAVCAVVCSLLCSRLAQLTTPCRVRRCFSGWFIIS
jgi:hypothetical protein